MVQVVVLDFDGVIVDSNHLKREAFFSLFSPAEKTVSLIHGVLSRSGRKSRFEILREILRAQGESTGALEERVAAYAERYNEKVQRGIAEIGVMAGVRESLGALSQAYRLYVNSGTYEPALHESIAGLDIAPFFRAVYGGPAGKADILRKIMAAEKVAGRETLVIGDGEEDCQSSLECGCFFIGLANEFNGWLAESFPIVSGLSSAVSLIESFSFDDFHGRGEGQNHRRRIDR